MKLSESTSISMPAKNLLAILAAVAVGTMSFFSIQERLNTLETNQQLMAQDMEAANEFIDGVPKGTMVSPQVNELYMLVEWLSKTQEELRTHVNAEIPEIAKLNMQIQFIEERMIDVEMLLDKIRQNGISHD
jgi:hypothetical protein|tara:strand:- start:133 stop:528 length:396 start_codon:yes stop_codon:yes gene_type:complete